MTRVTRPNVRRIIEKIEEYAEGGVPSEQQAELDTFRAKRDEFMESSGYKKRDALRAQTVKLGRSFIERYVQ